MARIPSYAELGIRRIMPSSGLCRVGADQPPAERILTIAASA